MTNNPTLKQPSLTLGCNAGGGDNQSFVTMKITEKLESS